MLFRHLQTEQESFIYACKQLFTPEYNESSRYYQLREEFNTCLDTRQRAILFLYLNRHGYNGLCRYNQQGIYNVPFGRYSKPYFPETEMRFFYEKSRNVNFLHGDFQNTFSHAKAGDVIYCDPPYAPISQYSNFSAYIHKKFGEKEQIILASLAEYHAERGRTVLISNHDTELTRHLYRRARILSFPVKRVISCRSDQRKPVMELLAIFHGLDE
jgi:DNA adenine methylase